jgi:hypothetical protein
MTGCCAVFLERERMLHFPIRYAHTGQVVQHDNLYSHFMAVNTPCMKIEIATAFPVEKDAERPRNDNQARPQDDAPLSLESIAHTSLCVNRLMSKSEG